MNSPASSIVSIENKKASVSIDLFGGAITDFHLKTNPVNPLSFAFTKEQMPANNRNGATYKGHFLCLGRWGEPSTGEIQAGIPNHGEVANVLWRNEEKDALKIVMQTTTTSEGLHVERKMELDAEQPVILITEKVKNINPLGRLFNIVQHPTLASPFLSNETVVDCNATKGFDQALYKQAAVNNISWPYAKNAADQVMDLHNPTVAYNAVFSFIVDKIATYGWITAYSPVHNILLGYVWKRKDYPWIHLWQHWNGNTIQYRGIEFGTAGIHQPFKEILDTAINLFQEKTLAFIDAGEIITKKYVAFLYQTETDFTGVESLQLEEDHILLNQKQNKPQIKIPVNKTLLDELSK